MNRFLTILFASIALSASEPIPYAPAPNDAYFGEQWYLENLDTNAVRRGFDLNARSGWTFSRGAGVTIAIVDNGVDLTHPDLTNQAASELHWDFESNTPQGHPKTDADKHGTPVAGLAVADGNNNRGVIGMAPEARFASWIVYKTNQSITPFVSGDRLAEMFQSHLNEVQVQNHSWIKSGPALVRMTPAEHLAISNAVINGRDGRGVVMVRAAGNERRDGRNANDDEYTADPRVITVAAIRSDGRVASYSNPGAPILVSAPGGEQNYRNLMTTDRVGPKGYNQISFGNDLADYVFASLGFQGTSAAAPLVSGTAALLLSANPNLTVRDVQHILVQSAFPTDLDDPDLQTTVPGLRVSHKTGFGLVNAGSALELATHWSNLPPAIRITNTINRVSPIPDAALRVHFAAGTNSSGSFIALPSAGLHPDDGTGRLPLVYVGQAVERLATNLTGKAALIQRGGTNYDVKLDNARRAGAAFAIVFNNTGTNSLELMGGTEFVRIPAVFISQSDGEALAALTTNSTVEAEIYLDTSVYEFTVAEPLITEHVQVRLDLAHTLRGDMRLTLVSPMGTRSVLHTLGPDISTLDGVWTYMSTHHFYESSRGTWRLEVSDEAQGSTGVVRSASLQISGIPIKDSDADALDDDWETARLGNLASSLDEDPDNDGFTNAREQIQGTDPKVNEHTLAVDLSAWNDSFLRLNWPSRSGVRYEILGTPALGQPFEILATLTGGFPRSAWFAPVDPAYRFFTIREAPQQ